MISKSEYILLNAYHVLIDGLFDSVPILLAFMAVYFGYGEKEVGFVTSLGGAAGTLAGLGSIFFARKFGFNHSVCLVTVIYGAGFFAASLSGSMAVAGLCFILAVAGHGIYHNIAFSHLTVNTERRLLGKVMSDFTAIGDIGRIPLVSFAGFAAAFTILGVSGWRTVCFGYGALALLAAGWLFISSRGKNDAPTTPAPKRRLPSFSLLRIRAVALSMLASALNAFSNDRVFTFLPLLLLDRGFDPKVIGALALGFTTGSFFGKMACGRLVDRVGARKVFIVAQLLLTVLLVALIFGRELVFIIIVALLLGVVTRGTVPVIQTIITEPVRDSQTYDDVFSISNFARGIINILTPLLFGLMAAAWGIDWIYALMAVVASIAVVPVLLMEKTGVEDSN